jgi:hypothetical protein
MSNLLLNVKVTRVKFDIRKTHMKTAIKYSSVQCGRHTLIGGPGGDQVPAD